MFDCLLTLLDVVKEARKWLDCNTAFNYLYHPHDAVS